MNSLLARNLSRRSQTLLSSRFYSKGAVNSKAAIPTSATMEIGNVKVVGLDHLTVRPSCQSYLLCHVATGQRPRLNDSTKYTQTPSMRSAARKKYWLSDAGCYPLIAVLGGAGALVVGFSAYFITTAPDVQISPLKRCVLRRYAPVIAMLASLFSG